jgi:DHA1 family tetracycline resistance protein-like MFS transporter
MRLIFFIILLDLMGIGLILPLFPFIALDIGLTPESITLVLAIYPIAQFFAGPIWGRLSDKYGRRPILMISMVGAVASYTLLGFADTVWLLMASRLIGGISAGNLAAAFAYITDITTPENRAKGMGLIGGALSLGFILGPAVGGLLAGGDPENANLSLVAFFAGGTSFLALLGTIFILPESLSDEIRAKIAERPKMNRLQQFKVVRTRGALLTLFGAALMFAAAESVFTTTFPLFANAKLGLGPREVGLILSFAGVVMVIMQLKAIGPLSKKFGELNLITTGCFVYAAGLALVATANGLPQLLLAQFFLPIGLSIVNPSLSSLISKECADTERGVVMGLYQSVGSLGRGMGPIYSGTLFGQISIYAPYVYSIASMVPVLGLIYVVRMRGKNAAPDAPAE